MSTHMIERGSPEHLRAVVDVHQGTLRMVNRLAANVRMALDAGDVEIARTELDAIVALTTGYAGSG